MTPTEAALQAALDANPGDQVARRALADYLMEIGDPRGPGYAALAARNRVPFKNDRWWFFSSIEFSDTKSMFAQPDGGGDRSNLGFDWFSRYRNRSVSTIYEDSSRKESEDAAALAYVPEESPCPTV